MRRLARLVCLLTASADLVLNSAAAAGVAYNLTTLASFRGSPHGALPRSSLILGADGALFGTTQVDADAEHGTVFRLSTETRELTTLVQFDGLNGSLPMSELVADADGNLYGTTNRGGAANRGKVFRLSAGTNELTTLVSFDGANGANPSARLILGGDGDLYGTTSRGGAHNYGTVFHVEASSLELTTVVSFDGADGAVPNSDLFRDRDGTFVGTTSFGGSANQGTVFRFVAATGELVTLASFDGANGAQPLAGLTVDAQGNLYGTAMRGGNNDLGTVFRLAAGANDLETLFSFDGVHGSLPRGGLIADAQGNLYGTTAAGGTCNEGTAFRFATATNELSTLVSFIGVNGARPYAGLVADGAGNLYGTSWIGGAFGSGSVYRLSPIPEPVAMTLVLAAASTFLLAIWRQDFANSSGGRDGSVLGAVAAKSDVTTRNAGRRS